MQQHLLEWTVREIYSSDTSQTTCNSTSFVALSGPTHRHILPAQSQYTNNSCSLCFRYPTKYQHILKKICLHRNISCRLSKLLLLLLLLLLYMHRLEWHYRKNILQGHSTKLMTHSQLQYKCWHSCPVIITKPSTVSTGAENSSVENGPEKPSITQPCTSGDCIEIWQAVYCGSVAELLHL